MRGTPQNLGGCNVFHLLQFQEFSPRQAGYSRPTRHTNDSHHRPDPWTLNDGNQCQDEDERGNTHHQFDEPTDEHVCNSTKETGDGTQSNSYCGSDSHGDETDEKCRPCAMYHLSKDIDSTCIGSKEIEATRFTCLRVRSATRPFVFLDLSRWIIKEERPDCPAFRVFFLKVFGISFSEFVFRKDCFPAGD